MIFEDVIEVLRKRLEQYKKDGYSTHLREDGSNYDARISRADKAVVIRDGYYGDARRNSKPPAITSFDVLLSIGRSTYLSYISDYPLEEYPDRMQDAFDLADNFFAGNYTTSEERSMLFWHRKYLNVNVNGEILSLLETHS